MDLNSLKDQVSNLTLYDLKAGVRKVQNAVMNYTEMEAKANQFISGRGEAWANGRIKVREATNNEPWGASSTLMQEISNATNSYQLLGEIMPMIYKRFTEKAAEEWRQIYKALQLLEFLIKNGSERVIDDARSHLGLLKMLRQFHFIDQNGKDQGVNVRNRSKELTELLGDVDRIRAERRKARANRNKFGGVEGGLSGGFSSGGSKYGGFGSEDTYGAYSGGVYGDGGGYGGNTSGFQDSSSRRDRFEEYDEFDEGAVKSPALRKTEMKATPTVKREPKISELPNKKEPELDILGFDDDDVPPATPPKGVASNGKRAVPNLFDDLSALQSSSATDDDFDDFQSATPAPQSSANPIISAFPPPLSTNSASSTAQFAAPKPVSSFQGTSLDRLVGFNSISPAPGSTSSFTAPSSSIAFTALPAMNQQSQQPRPTGYQAAKPNYYTSVPTPSTATSKLSPSGAKPTPQSNTNSFSKPTARATKSTGDDVFGSLWSTASATAGIKTTTTSSVNQGPNLASLAKEKAAVGMWGASSSSNQNQSPASSMGAGLPQGQAQTQRTAGAAPPRLGGIDDLLG